MEFSKQPMNKWRKTAALPEEFSWENMKDGIAIRMNRNKRKKWIIIFICCFGLIGLISASWYFTTNDTDQPSSPEKNTENIDYAVINENTESNADEHVIDNIDQSSGQTKTKLISNNNSEGKFYAPTDIERHKEKIVSTTINEKAGIENTDVSIQDELIAGHAAKNPTTIQEFTFSENSSAQENSHVPHLKTHVFYISKAHPDDDLKPYFSPLQLEQHNNRKFDKDASTTWKLDGGVAFWKTGQDKKFELASAEHIASISERTLPGFSLSMKYNRQIKNNFYTSAGIDFQQLYSVFTYDGVKKSTIKLDDIITKVEYNLLTGDETVTRGAAQVDHTIYRKLQNLNRISGFSIPVNIGYQHQYNKWQINAEAGISIHVFSFGKGKTLYDGEIVAYNGKIPGLHIYPKIGLDGRLGVSYSLTPKIHAGINISMNQYLINWTDDKALSLKPSFFGIGLGMEYMF